MQIYSRGRPKKYDPKTGAGTLPPHAPGEYRIRDGKKHTILYIGETNDLRRRMQEHIRSGKIAQYLAGARRRSCYFEYMVANAASDSALRREHERKKIKQHKPSLNKSKGGEGRPALRERLAGLFRF